MEPRLVAPSGVRIRHPDPRFRGALLRVPHPTRRTAAGPKTYELRLDGEGAVIVSETVWRRIQECFIPSLGGPSLLAGHVFEVVNEVRNPPGLIVGGSAQHMPTFDLSPETITPAGVREHHGITTKD